MPERTKAQRHNVYQGAKAQIRRREIRECSMWRDNKIKPRQVQELRYGLEALSVSRQPNFTRIAWQRNEKNTRDAEKQTRRTMHGWPVTVVVSINTESLLSRYAQTAKSGKSKCRYSLKGTWDAPNYWNAVQLRRASQLDWRIDRAARTKIEGKMDRDSNCREHRTKN